MKNYIMLRNIRMEGRTALVIDLYSPKGQFIKTTWLSLAASEKGPVFMGWLAKVTTLRMTSEEEKRFDDYLADKNVKPGDKVREIIRCANKACESIILYNSETNRGTLHLVPVEKAFKTEYAEEIYNDYGYGKEKRKRHETGSKRQR